MKRYHLNPFTRRLNRGQNRKHNRSTLSLSVPNPQSAAHTGMHAIVRFCAHFRFRALIRLTAVGCIRTLRRLPLALLPALLVIAAESMSRNSFALAFGWMYEFPNEWWLNYGIVLAAIMLTTAMLGRSRPAYLVLLLAGGLFAFASGVKMNQTGTPLFLWDLLLPGDTMDAARPFNPHLTWELVAGAGAVVVIGIMLFFLKAVRLKLHPAERAGYAAIALLLLVSYYADFPIPFKEDAGVFNISWDQAENYERNGYWLSTLMGVDLVRIGKPSHTGSSEIRELVRSVPQPEGGSSPGPSGQTERKPNIIVVLSESFWDPTRMTNVTFSEDPIPFFRSLMRDYTGGRMLSPQFGGGTANVEFEVLSGLSTRFLPKDSIAYIEYMNRGTDSLASILTRQGYTATAFNPFFNWFFNSRNTYKNFGFSRFISCEFFDPVFHGPNYEDKQVMDRVIAWTEQTEGPDFVFANTMENHGPYPNKFGVNSIKVSGPVTDESKNMLENYATGIRAFDDAFRTLIKHYAASAEPTIVLCFGDHLPGLGSDYQAFRDAKYISGKDDPDFLEKMYETPFVIWSNFPTGAKETLRLSPNYLSPFLLHMAGRSGTYFTDFLYGLSKRIPLIPPEGEYGRMGIDPNELAGYRQLQYDVLFGGQYAYREKGIYGRIVQPGFALGYGEPVVYKAAFNGEHSLEIAGDRFTDDCTVWWNGRKLDTDWHNVRQMTAKLPDGISADQAASGKLEIRLTDRKNTVIAKSAPFTVSK